MTDQIKPIGYSIDEAAKRLREPAISRGTMYNLMNAGVLVPSGYIGDRPYFTEQALKDCVERLPGRAAAAAHARLRRTRP